MAAFSIILLLSAFIYYLVVSPLGGKMLVRYVKQEFSSIGLMHVGHYEGSLKNGFILKDVRVTDLTYLPNALMRIQEIQVQFPYWVPMLFDYNIFNARIILPDSDPIVFTGKISGGQIKGNLYGKSFDLHEASRFWAPDDIRNNLQGFASNFDVNIQGSLSSPTCTGYFLLDHIRFKSILLTDGFSRGNVIFMPVNGQIQMKGEVIIESGLVNVRKTNLDLHQSKFNFRGDIYNPILDIHLGSKVEDMEINLAIKGPLTSAQLTVTSDPPMLPQEALRVLFTGNAWATPTSAFNGVTSGELAQNFLNYSLSDMSDQQQFGLKTKLTDNLKLGAEVDQRPMAPWVTNTYYSRKVNGELDLSEHMSLNISQEVLTQGSNMSTSYSDTQAQPETEIYLQYKKRF